MEKETIVSVTMEEIYSIELPLTKQLLVIGKSLFLIPLAVVMFLLRTIRDLFLIPGATVDIISLGEKLKIAAFNKLEEK